MVVDTKTNEKGFTGFVQMIEITKQGRYQIIVVNESQHVKQIIAKIYRSLYITYTILSPFHRSINKVLKMIQWRFLLFTFYGGEK